MPTRFDRSAILIFTRSATHEAAVKVFDPASGQRRNKAIARSLIRQTLDTAHRSRLRVFLYTTPDQSARTFGENFADALESVFHQGYDHVVAIGNDCPTLSADNLVQAARQLEKSSLVLGPASDGGAYLIGMRKTAYDRGVFLRIDWQTPLVLEELKASGSGDYYCLEEKSDVDSLADLARILHSGILPGFLKFRFLNFLQCRSLAGFCLALAARSLVFPANRPLRGPPRLCTVSAG